jgi:hypothetical protein
MASPRLATPKSVAAVKLRMQTGSGIVGWTLAVLTKPVALSFRKPLTPCIDGINLPGSVTFIYQMFVSF